MREGLRDRLERKARRMDAARSGPKRTWVGLGMVGVVGWMIALPTAAGALGGHVLDMHLGSGVTYGLAGLLLGLTVGGYTVWRFVLRGIE